MITYQIEDYAICRAEIDSYLFQHWQEIALDHAAIPLDKNEEAYQQMADNGELHILTVRKDGILVGYIAGIIRIHLHYRSSLHCFVDVFFLRPDCRRGRIGIDLFKRFQESLKARGVKKCFIASKVHLDMGKLFDRLGWRKTETVYSFLP